MAKFVIKGGAPLSGVVRLGGAKNASFKLMIGSLLIKGESRLLNFSRIEDVKLTSQIIKSLGGEIRKAGERTLFLNASLLTSSVVPAKLGLASRASSMFIPVLLHRMHKAIVPVPGGDKIGKRPLDRHFEGLIKMGAKFEQKGKLYYFSAAKLKGIEYCFSKNTHTGTETLIMAAVLAKGKTVLKNAALEPEVDDLINFLNLAGAKIKRKTNRIIEIVGVSALRPVIYQIMPDRNEAVSYGVAALASRGDVVLENARAKDLEVFLEKVDEVGGGYELGNYGIRIYYKGRMKKTSIITKPHPGFMTDWQPLWSVLATQSHGVSEIIETIHPFRFHYIDTLKKMGSKISTFDPKPNNPDKFYNFNLKNDSKKHFHAISISGPTQLKAVKARVPDLRAGATMVLAALCASGTSEISNICHIDRGYENLDGRLRDLGAKIKRLE